MKRFGKMLTALVVVSAVGASALPASADQYWRDFELVNYSGYEVTAVYATHIDNDEWGPNRLVQWIGGNGGSAWIAPYFHQGYCRFDIKIVYADGVVDEIWDVNLCAEHLVISEPNGAYVA